MYKNHQETRFQIKSSTRYGFSAMSNQGAIGTSGDRGGSPYVKSHPYPGFQTFRDDPSSRHGQRCGVAGNISGWWIVELTFFPAPGD